MAFKVRFSGQTESQDFGDDDGFEFLEGGVLAIHFGDEETWPQFHSPTQWEQVTAGPDHLAGLNTPYVDEEDEDEDFDEDGEEFEDEDYEDENDEYETGDD
jgi:hypothetical protein